MIKPEISYIYVIGAPGIQAVKIGYAANVDARLSGHQVSSPFPLAVLWKERFPEAAAVEAALKRRFRSQRVRGEWYDLGPDAARVVREACKRIVPGALHGVPPGLTDAEQVLWVLRTAEGKPVAAQFIHGKTGLHYANAVRPALARLVQEGQVRDTGKNSYVISSEEAPR